MTKSYIAKNGKVLFVSTGLNYDQWGTFYGTGNSLHRVKSLYMPMVHSKEEAQANLDRWAAQRGLQTAGGE